MNSKFCVYDSSFIADTLSNMKLLATNISSQFQFISRLQDPAHASRPKTDAYGYVSKFRDLETFPRQWKLKV